MIKLTRWMIGRRWRSQLFIKRILIQRQVSLMFLCPQMLLRILL